MKWSIYSKLKKIQKILWVFCFNFAWFCFPLLELKLSDECFLFSFDPDNDPMCVLLMIDFYALRASEYSFLIRMFQEWEVKTVSWGMKICLVFWIFTLYVWYTSIFVHVNKAQFSLLLFVSTIFIVVICYFLNR